MSEKKEIEVYADWLSLDKAECLGTLVATSIRGKEIFSFEYSEDWLKSGFTHLLDPELQLYSGRFFPKEEKSNFGIFLDSCPDRWGRVLMDRREAVLARREKRSEKRLLESDYLLGVYDGHRMGAIRYRLRGNDVFINNDINFTVPPWTSLRELEHASIMFERDNTDDEHYLDWINMLMAPGSSLGGARPKASVLDSKNSLWIAKFPSINDNKNTGAWEWVAHILAKKAGLDVSEAMAENFHDSHHTFLSRRFDRSARGERIHFASAMTMLGYNDGASFESGVSYLEIAEFIMKNGVEVDIDLNELWKRIVFNICIKNTDDHLRNHGFLLTDNGWKLSPAYDMNPNEFGVGLRLNISQTDNSLDLELAVEVAEYFRVEKSKIKVLISQIQNATSQWRQVATAIGISRSEQEMMKRAFE